MGVPASANAVHVLAVGSPFGDDRLAWVAARQLRRSPVRKRFGNRVAIACLDRPGTQLVRYLSRAAHLLVIDAMRSRAPLGYLHVIRDIAALQDLPDPLSSHGFGIAQAFALAHALGCAPASWVMLGIEADTSNKGTTISAPVRAAMPALIATIEAELLRHVALSETRHNREGCASAARMVTSPTRARPMPGDETDTD